MALDEKSEVEKFDRFAADYSKAHSASLRLSGEGPEYFARHKLTCLERLACSPQDRVLDYGCGTGSLTHLLADKFSEVHGFDPSARSLEVATDRSPSATFHSSPAEIVDNYFDCAVLSGVLHHVEKEARLGLLKTVVAKLKPETGRLVIFEHNPINPLTLRAVQACPFDDDAVLLPPLELRRLLADAGMRPVEQRYVLFFPRPLRVLRPLEKLLEWCPLGAQTLSVGRRPPHLDE